MMIYYDLYHLTTISMKGGGQKKKRNWQSLLTSGVIGQDRKTSWKPWKEGNMKANNKWQTTFPASTMTLVERKLNKIKHRIIKLNFFFI